MTVDEAKQLLAACAAFDNRQPSLIAARAWARALQDMPMDQDAIEAVARFYGTPPKEPGARLWIQPHDVRTHRRLIRAERAQHFVYEPPAVDEGAERFLARYRAQLDAVASGRAPAASTAPALEGGPHERVAKVLKGLGREVPAEDEQPVRRPGPLGIVCPKCSALVGRPCRLPSGAERPRPHRARVRAAQGEPVATETPQEIARRRAAARLLADGGAA